LGIVKSRSSLPGILWMDMSGVWISLIIILQEINPTFCPVQMISMPRFGIFLVPKS
jgi:hypothetical protein